MVLALADYRMSVNRDLVMASLQSVLRRLIALGRNPQWATYASAWLDGSMMRGTFTDPVMARPAVPMDFVRDACSGLGAKSYEKRPDLYVRARSYEHAAWAVVFFEAGEYERALKFITMAENSAGLTPEGLTS